MASDRPPRVQGPTRPQVLPFVQVLRAFAALLVVVHHLQNDAAVLAARSGTAFAPSHLLPWNAGVDVFFVISGFIIVHAAGPLFGVPGAPRRFLAHRVARVVPLYWLVTTLYLAVALAVPGVLDGGRPGAPEAGQVVASYLFWPCTRPDGAVMPLYSLGWTLNYEMAFYGLFALCLVLPRRAAVAAAVAALAGLPLAGALTGPLPLPFAFWAEPIVLEFALGALIGLARAEGLHLSPALRAGLAVAGLLLLAAVGEGRFRPLAWGGPAALLVAAAALGRPWAADVSDRPLTRAAVAVGDASYALYLVHPFVGRAARELVWRSGIDLAPPAFIGLALLAAVAASLAVHRLVERPLTRRGRAWLEPDGRTLPAAGGARP